MKLQEKNDVLKVSSSILLAGALVLSSPGVFMTADALKTVGKEGRLQMVKQSDDSLYFTPETISYYPKKTNKIGFYEIDFKDKKIGDSDLEHYISNNIKTLKVFVNGDEYRKAYYLSDAKNEFYYDTKRILKFTDNAFTKEENKVEIKFNNKLIGEFIVKKAVQTSLENAEITIVPKTSSEGHAQISISGMTEPKAKVFVESGSSYSSQKLGETTANEDGAFNIVLENKKYSPTNGEYLRRDTNLEVGAKVEGKELSEYIFLKLELNFENALKVLEKAIKLDLESDSNAKRDYEELKGYLTKTYLNQKELDDKTLALENLIKDLPKLKVVSLKNSSDNNVNIGENTITVKVSDTGEVLSVLDAENNKVTEIDKAELFKIGKDLLEEADGNKIIAKIKTQTEEAIQLEIANKEEFKKSNKYAQATNKEVYDKAITKAEKDMEKEQTQESLTEILKQINTAKETLNGKNQEDYDYVPIVADYVEKSDETPAYYRIYFEDKKVGYNNIYTHLQYDFYGDVLVNGQKFEKTLSEIKKGDIHKYYIKSSSSKEEKSCIEFTADAFDKEENKVFIKNDDEVFGNFIINDAIKSIKLVNGSVNDVTLGEVLYKVEVDSEGNVISVEDEKGNLVKEELPKSSILKMKDKILNNGDLTKIEKQIIEQKFSDFEPFLKLANIEYEPKHINNKDEVDYPGVYILKFEDVEVEGQQIDEYIRYNFSKLKFLVNGEEYKPGYNIFESTKKTVLNDVNDRKKLIFTEDGFTKDVNDVVVIFEKKKIGNLKVNREIQANLNSVSLQVEPRTIEDGHATLSIIGNADANATINVYKKNMHDKRRKIATGVADEKGDYKITLKNSDSNPRNGEYLLEGTDLIITAKKEDTFESDWKVVVVKVNKEVAQKLYEEIKDMDVDANSEIGILRRTLKKKLESSYLSQRELDDLTINIKQELLKEDKKQKETEIDSIVLTDEEKADKTEESIELATQKLEELKTEAKGKLEKATTLEEVQRITVDKTEATKLLVDKSVVELEEAKANKLKEIDGIALTDIEKADKTEGSVKLATQKLEELKTEAKGKLEKATTLEEVQGITVDKTEATKLLVDKKISVNFKKAPIEGQDYVVVDTLGLENKDKIIIVKVSEELTRSSNILGEKVLTEEDIKNEEVKINLNTKLEFEDQIKILVQKNGMERIIDTDVSIKTLKKSKPRKPSRHRKSSNDVISVKKTDRISGTSRIDTAIEVSKKMYPRGSKNIILANMNSFADVITAVPLSVQLKAPILFVKTNDVTQNNIKEIERLNVTNIYIIGGENSVSKEVEKQLNGKTIERISGIDRYETSIKIAEKIREKGNKSIIEIANGNIFADALAISSLATKDNAPIILVNKDGNGIEKFLEKSTIGIKTINIAGMHNSVSNKAEEKIKKIKGVKVNRYGGIDRYETAVKIMEVARPNSERGIYASGEVFADALLAGPYAASKHAPVLLVNKNSVPGSVVNVTKRIKRITIIGGENSVSEEVLKRLEEIAK